MPYSVRPAGLDDAEAIARLSNHYILHTTVHFAYEPWPPEAVREALEGAADSRHPWRVAVDARGRFAGYAKASAWRSRAAYRFTAETACYVDPTHHRRGVGRLLYADLLDALAQGGFHGAVAGVTQPNPASEGLHRAVGFREVGTFREVGFKAEGWRDVRWFQRILSV